MNAPRGRENARPGEPGTDSFGKRSSFSIETGREGKGGVVMRGKAAKTRQEPPLRSLLGRLASLRDVSIEAVTEAHKRRLLTFPVYRGELCWRFGDGRNGCFRRLDGQPFKVGNAHAKTLSTRRLAMARSDRDGGSFAPMTGTTPFALKERRTVSPYSTSLTRRDAFPASACLCALRRNAHRRARGAKA